LKILIIEIFCKCKNISNINLKWLPMVNQTNKEWGSSLLGQLVNNVSMGGNCGQFLWEIAYGQMLNMHTNWKDIIILALRFDNFWKHVASCKFKKMRPDYVVGHITCLWNHNL
jgi:hypothetical protein